MEKLYVTAAEAPPQRIPLSKDEQELLRIALAEVHAAEAQLASAQARCDALADLLAKKLIKGPGKFGLSLEECAFVETR